MSARIALLILMMSLPGLSFSATRADIESDILVQQLLSSVERGDHASVLLHIDKLRELSPDVGGELLYIEAEAAHALERHQRAHDAAYRYASEMGRNASRYDDALSIIAATRPVLEERRARAERERIAAEERNRLVMERERKAAEERERRAEATRRAAEEREKRAEAKRQEKVRERARLAELERQRRDEIERQEKLERERRARKEQKTMEADGYRDNDDGTVTDTRTGLTWMRCSVGEEWTGTACSGRASVHQAWTARDEILPFSFAGKDDWRIPTHKELATLVLCDEGRKPLVMIEPSDSYYMTAMTRSMGPEEDTNGGCLEGKTGHPKTHRYAFPTSEWALGYIQVYDNPYRYMSKRPEVGGWGYVIDFATGELEVRALGRYFEIHVYRVRLVR